MSAVFKPLEARFEPMADEHLDQVVAVEQAAYAHPWTRGNFSDSIRAGYQTQILMSDEGLIGYFIAMKGVEEVHLLNITVAPAWQGQGWGRILLDALAVWSRGQGAQWLWLEVRVSNARALAVYDAHGYRQVGLRKGYYPNAEPVHNGREDAVVMSLKL